MKCIALLRGINVGGNTLIKMAELKTAVEECGFTKVITYINSGNVLFDTTIPDTKKIEELLEKKLFEAFHFKIKVVVIPEQLLQTVMDNVPNTWKKPNNLRCYMAFVKPPTTPQDVAKEMNLHADVDAIKLGAAVLYMTTTLEGLTKSGFSKLASKKVYKEITIRNYTTMKKLLDMTSL